MTEQSRRLELAANHLAEAIRLSLGDDPAAATAAEDCRTAYLWLAGRHGWLAPDDPTPHRLDDDTLHCQDCDRRWRPDQAADDGPSHPVCCPLCGSDLAPARVVPPGDSNPQDRLIGGLPCA